MIKCKKYSTYQQRKNICNSYHLCIYCTSSKHNSQDCLGLSNRLTYPCIYCNKNSHISALCRESKNLNSNICINSSVGNVDNLFLLPIVCINVFKGKSKFSLNCLLDTGSQRNYISHNFVNTMKFVKEKFRNVNFNVKTFLSTKLKNLQEITLDLEVSNKRKLPLQLLIDDDFDIKFQIAYLEKALFNF